MNYVKQRLAVFLAMLMAFTTVFCVLPQETVQAATGIRFEGVQIGTIDKVTFQVAKGAEELYIGDYIEVRNYISTGMGDMPTVLGYLSELKGVTYTSSNKKVLKVDKKTGKVSAKKKGTATITVKYKGKTQKIKMKVISPSEMDYDEEYAAAEKFVKAVGTANLKSGNCYKMLKALANYFKIVFKDGGGMSVGIVHHAVNQSGNKTVSIYSAKGRAYVLAKKLTDAFSKWDPWSVTSDKSFNIRYISGKANSKEIKIKLKGNVTKEQLVGLKHMTLYANKYKVSDSKSYTFPVQIKRMQNGTSVSYEATATVKQGKNYITIKTKNMKLKKGTSYNIEIERRNGWYHWFTGNIDSSFTVK